MRIALIGYGNVARALVKILLDQQDEHPFTVAGILRRSGASTGVFDPLNPACDQSLSIDDFLDRAEPQVLVELTTLNPEAGQPAISHIEKALARGMHVATANKGPVAHAYAHLAKLARHNGVRFLHESAVMDGAPVFNLFRHNLPGVKVLGFTGVLNSTSKLIIETMERGLSFDEGVREAQRLGVAEENYTFDTDGWDSAAKSAALANVLMGANTTPAHVLREGIGGVTPERMAQLNVDGKTIRIVSRAETTVEGIRVSARAEVLPFSDLFASLAGTSNMILFQTDRMGTLGTVSIAPRVEQTAYGVYIDLMDLVRYPEALCD